jgi:hypothetical protein
LIESHKRIKWFIEKRISFLNIKTFDELLSLLNVKNEEEFATDIFLIFGEKTNKELNRNDLKEIYWKVSNCVINYKEFISCMAFFRIENIHDKLNCN